LSATGPRLAVDIGGTFTDLVLALPDGRHLSTKLLTTPTAPEAAVLDGTRQILARAGLAPEALSLVIHGCTLTPEIGIPASAGTVWDVVAQALLRPPNFARSSA
jgi:predicted NBD/HSP70 family sugar kinase